MWKIKTLLFKTKRNLITSSEKSNINTSLRLPPIYLEKLPKLSNFSAAKDFFSQKVLEGNRELEKIWVAPNPIASAFRKIFPEIVESRGITQLEDNTFHRWDEQNNKKSNEILIEIDSDNIKPQEHIEMLAVGGPSTLTASLVYKLRHPSANVVHAVASRHDSNHDGSAYYFHERDAFPVYVNKVNRGPYCVYIDLKKRLMGGKRLLKSAIHDRHHVKISMNWKNIRPSMVFSIFIPNVWHMLNDIYLKDPKDTLMRHTIEHAKRTHDIVDSIVSQTSLTRENMLIQGKEKACYVGFTGSTSPEEHFKWLNKYTNIPFQVIDQTKAFGKEVQQVITFPRDGLINPWIFENLSQQLKSMGAEIRKNFQIEKLLVKRTAENNLNVTKVVWRNTTNSQECNIASVDNIILSLGPSATFKANPPKYSLLQHLLDICTNQPREIYDPTIRSFGLHVINRLKAPLTRGTQVLKEFMYAAGSSSVIMIGLNTAKVSETQLEVFTKFLDGVNQHWTPIAERDVQIGTKIYRFYAIQMTGGGNFPSRKVRPDYLVNLLHSTERMYGLNEIDDVIYDCVQSRGCGRGVSAKNSVSFISLADNAVVAYAQGGIGMTTMFPNGELMIQLLEKGKGKGANNMANGLVGNTKLQRRVYRRRNVLEGIDYTHLIDGEGKVARMFGWFGQKPSELKKKLSLP